LYINRTSGNILVKIIDINCIVCYTAYRQKKGESIDNIKSVEEELDILA